MLGWPGDENRAIKWGKPIDATAKSIAVFLLHGPSTIELPSTEDWLVSRHDSKSTRQGLDFLTSLLRTIVPNTFQDFLCMGAGPQRYVVFASFKKAPDKVDTYRFPSVEKMVGTGWRRDPIYASASVSVLKESIDEFYGQNVQFEEGLLRLVLRQ